MAYCPNCGAYVPDGQGICLACKYDLEAAEKRKAEEAAASASAQQSAPDSNEEMRRTLEEPRRRARSWWFRAIGAWCDVPMMMPISSAVRLFSGSSA